LTTKGISVSIDEEDLAFCKEHRYSPSKLLREKIDELKVKAGFTGEPKEMPESEETQVATLR
jgi:hypothetical protein